MIKRNLFPAAAISRPASVNLYSYLCYLVGGTAKCSFHRFCLAFPSYKKAAPKLVASLTRAQRRVKKRFISSTTRAQRRVKKRFISSTTRATAKGGEKNCRKKFHNS